jgi:2-polyprenyl-6-hydroxyphenyl methylase/3-demethylubiquinone-9 3-methyltransferase
MKPLPSSDWLWKPGSGYYTEEAQQLRWQPILPDVSRLRDRRIQDVFRTHGGVERGSSVLEIGCGRSPWLPFLAREAGCQVTGLDIEPEAAELARANLTGAGATGRVICADAFDAAANDELQGRFDLVYSFGVMEHFADPASRLAVLRGYLRPGGRILTFVPNLRGVNWVMQRLAYLRILELHVVYGPASLARVHAEAGFVDVEAGCVGFYDGWLSSAAGAPRDLRRTLHRWLCRTSGRAAEAWARAGRGSMAPELDWLAPHVFCAARQR